MCVCVDFSNVGGLPFFPCFLRCTPANVSARKNEKEKKKKTQLSLTNARKRKLKCRMERTKCTLETVLLLFLIHVWTCF